MMDTEELEQREKERKGPGKIRILVVILLVVFLALAAVTGFLFYYYFTMSKDVSELKNTDSWMTEELSYLKYNETEQRSKVKELKETDFLIKKELSHLKYTENVVIKSELNHIKHRVDILELKSEGAEPTKRTSCDTDWLSFQGHCYYFSTTQTDWMTAETMCQNKGGGLAIITSKEEQDFLNNNRMDRFYWIGLTDLENENEFLWIDGTSISHSAWMPGEPNNYEDEDEDCIAVWRNGEWNDVPCDTMHYAICEKELT